MGKKHNNTPNAQRTRCTAFLIIIGRMTKWQQYHTTPVRMAIHTSLQAINVGERQQVREPLYTFGGNAHLATITRKDSLCMSEVKVPRE